MRSRFQDLPWKPSPFISTPVCWTHCSTKLLPIPVHLEQSFRYFAPIKHKIIFPGILDVSTQAVWASLNAILEQIKKVHPDCHIYYPNLSYSESGPSEFSVHQKTTRKKPEVSQGSNPGLHFQASGEVWCRNYFTLLHFFSEVSMC